MDQNILKELAESIKPELEAEVVYLNERQEAFDKINKAFQSLLGIDVQLLINKIEYRIGSLINAHKFSSVANQEEVEKDISELNHLVSELNNVILDIENIRLEMGNAFSEPKYQEFADRLTSVIDRTLSSCDLIVRKATDVLSNKFDSVETQEVETKPVEEVETEEEKLEELTPTHIKTDSIEDLEKELDASLQPIQEDKKELELAKSDLEDAQKVTSIEPAPQAIIAPVLQPESNPDLNTFFNQGIQPEDNKVVEYTPVKEEMKSAANVDEGPVLVTNVETFDLNEDKAQEGPVLTRAV